MKLKYIFYLILLPVVFLTDCSNCEKLHLTQSEKEWVNHFRPGQQLFYKSNNGTKAVEYNQQFFSFKDKVMV